MKITNYLKSLLPVTRKQHQAELDKVNLSKATALSEMRQSFNKAYAQTVETVMPLVEKLSSISWEQRGYGDFAVRLNISADMLFRARSPEERKLLAEAIGRQVAHEIERSKFIEPPPAFPGREWYRAERTQNGLDHKEI